MTTWSYFVCVIVIVTVVPQINCQLCKDLDASACHILAATPNFCATSPTANTYCPRTCGKCALTCYHCPQQSVLDYHNCTTTMQCPRGQTCIIRSLHSHDGHFEHIMTCDEEKYCNGFGLGFGGSLIGRRHIAPRDVGLHCCHTDLCNRPNYTATTVPTATITVLPPIHSCHSDIVFVVDESGSIGNHGFKQVVALIKDIVSRIDIGIHNAQVSLVLYDNTPHLQWYLQQYPTKAKLLNALGYVPYHNGTTRTDLALKYVRENVLQYANGDRLGAKNVVVVITDGQSNIHSSTVNEANTLKNDNATVVVVGIEQADPQELVQIASPHKAIQIINLDATAKALERLVEYLC